MNYLIALVTFLAVPSARADLVFDKWRFSELLVSGLKAADQGDSEAVDRALTQVQSQLARLNVEIDHLYPNDREKGYALAVEVLTEPIRQAWRLEKVEASLPAQRQFLLRLFALGSSDNIATTVKALQKAVETDISNLRPANFAVIGSLGAIPVVAGLYGVYVMHDGLPLVAGGVASAFVTALATLFSTGWRSICDFEYTTNFINPVFRECELELLRNGENRECGVGEGGPVSRET